MIPRKTEQKASMKREKRGRAGTPTLQILLIILPLVILTYLVPTGLYLEGPGPASEVESRVEISDAPTYDNPGQLMLTTVSLRPVSTLEMSVVLLGEDKLTSASDLLGPNPDPQQYNEGEVTAMNISKQTAAAVALQRLGYQVQISQGGVLVRAVEPGAPADGRLQQGDIITALGGQTVNNTNELILRVNEAGIGVNVTFRVKRGDQVLDIEVMTKESSSLPGRAVVGITITDQVDIQLPFPVDIDTKDIAGPSAGMMMTLAVVDVLTPGGITGGKDIAGTGTISPDGAVGAIGGIDFKIAAAEDAGAVAFIYPRDNDADIDKAKVKIPIYPVGTIDEALDAVRAIAADN